MKQNNFSKWSVLLSLLVAASFLPFILKSASAAACASLDSEVFSLVKKVDRTHYLLKNSKARDNSLVLMETKRGLSGNDIHFSEGHFLRIDYEKGVLISKWKEGCSEKQRQMDRDLADPYSGKWYLGMAPDDQYCVDPVSDSYNLSPATLIKLGCSTDNSIERMLILDCTRTALGFKVQFFRRKADCQTFESLVRAQQ